MWRMSRKERTRLERLRGWAGSTEGYANAFSATEVRALQGRLQGDAVLPSDGLYAADRQLSNFAFQSFPLLIVYCKVFQDVWECLQFAVRHSLWITTRSGGHSTAGFSLNDGMVIDTSRLNGVYVDTARKVAVVGPGSNWGHVNATLADYGLHMPTGGCGDVCVAGYMQGGGYGFTSRKFGMNCDNVVDMLVMLADGRIVRANEDSNADLFWALRGGTGNNFGILLQVTSKLHDMPRLWGFTLTWSLDQAPAALAAWQAGFMSSGAPPELGYMGVLACTGKDLTPQLTMCGLYWGRREDGMKVIQPLMKATGGKIGAKPATRRPGSAAAASVPVRHGPWPGSGSTPPPADRSKTRGPTAQRSVPPAWPGPCDPAAPSVSRAAWRAFRSAPGRTRCPAPSV